MERSGEKKKALEHELGRWKKKAADQKAELETLGRRLAEAEAGGAELGRLVDALLAAVTVACGSVVRDEESGEMLGWRLALPGFSQEETLARYRLQAGRDAAGGYVLGAVRSSQASLGEGGGAAEP